MKKHFSKYCMVSIFFDLPEKLSLPLTRAKKISLIFSAKEAQFYTYFKKLQTYCVKQRGNLIFLGTKKRCFGKKSSGTSLLFNIIEMFF
jgi:4'-phosphopantetheinyl transferase EntD